MHRCRAHPCTVESSLLLCMLFLTLATPTTTVWLTLQLHPLACTAMFWFKHDGLLLFGRSGLRHG